MPALSSQARRVLRVRRSTDTEVKGRGENVIKPPWSFTTSPSSSAEPSSVDAVTNALCPALRRPNRRYIVLVASKHGIGLRKPDARLSTRLTDQMVLTQRRGAGTKQAKRVTCSRCDSRQGDALKPRSGRILSGSDQVHSFGKQVLVPVEKDDSARAAPVGVRWESSGALARPQ